MIPAIPQPITIELNQKNRVLHIEFDNGKIFDLSCEYLRVYSPSAENRVKKTQGAAITGKEQVNISDIQPTGTYSLKLVFDDGHDTGIYSWETLYALGIEEESNWQTYLDDLSRVGYQRNAEDGVQRQHAGYRIKIKYFSDLVTKLGKKEENLTAPATVKDIKTLLVYLRSRGKEWTTALKKEHLQITVNHEFAALNTPLKAHDEVALMPTRQ